MIYAKMNSCFISRIEVKRHVHKIIVFDLKASIAKALRI